MALSFTAGCSPADHKGGEGAVGHSEITQHLPSRSVVCVLSCLVLGQVKSLLANKLVGLLAAVSRPLPLVSSAIVCRITHT